MEKVKGMFHIKSVYFIAVKLLNTSERNEDLLKIKVYVAWGARVVENSNLISFEVTVENYTLRTPINSFGEGWSGSVVEEVETVWEPLEVKVEYVQSFLEAPAPHEVAVYEPEKHE